MTHILRNKNLVGDEEEDVVYLEYRYDIDDKINKTIKKIGKLYKNSQNIENLKSFRMNYSMVKSLKFFRKRDE